jgi:PAS domain S-box-containing protein
MEFDYPNLNGKDFYQARLVPEFAVDGSVESVLSIVRKITQLKQAEEALQRVNEQLEIRVQERTAELVLINESLQAEIETRKRTEEALHRREQEFKALVENAPDIIARLDRQLRHVYVNPAIELATGLSSEAFVGKTNRDLGMSEELVSYWESVIHKVFETGQQEVIEFHYPTPSGIKYYQSRIVPELAIDGSIEFTLSISRDITDVYEELRLRKQAEAALRESEQRFRAIFNQAAVGIAQVGLEGQWLLVNQKLGDIVGYSYEELLERRFQDITHPDDLDADIEYVRQMLAGEIQTYSREKRYIHKNGYYIWINLIVSLVCNLSDEPQYFISVVEDISDRRRTEEEIRLLQTITQAITEAPDFEGALEIALCKVCETTGWNFGEAWIPHPRENILELSPAWYSSTESLNQFRRENEAFTFPLNTGLPGRVWASKQPEWIPDISIQPEAVFLRSRMAQHSGLNVALGIPIIARESEVSGQESQVLAIFVFFTFESRQEDKRLVEIVSSVANQLGLVIQRKRTEAELQKSLKDLSDIKFALDQSAIVAITDARGVITYVNDKFCEISHYSREELIGKTHRIINSGYHPKEFFKDLWSTISTGKVWQGEINNRAKDGSYYWVDTAIVPFLDDQGKPFQYLAIRFDISERKRAEQEIKELNQNLERRVAERTAELEAANQELEAFSYSVSHDLRAPLRGVDGFSQTLLDRYNDTLDDRGKHYLQRIRAGTQRMGELIDDLLKLSRVTRSEMQRTQVDLSALAREIAAELQRTQPERQVEWAIAPGIFAHGDVQLLRIVLENLLNNSWKFTSLRIQTRIELGIIPQADAKVAYFVRDNGVGFDMAYANKLFGAFQRLHSQAQFPGTGIGLATVQRIIHRHGGRVWAQGAVEQGASFYFTLHHSQELR